MAARAADLRPRDRLLVASRLRLVWAAARGIVREGIVLGQAAPHRQAWRVRNRCSACGDDQHGVYTVPLSSRRSRPGPQPWRSIRGAACVWIW